jgi:gliding motility-associated-like protein
MNKFHKFYPIGLLLFGFLLHFGELSAQCGCTHIIPLNAAVYTIDGTTFKAIDGSIGVKPGDKVCFQSGTRPDMLIKNMHGTAAQPITFTNMCDGKVTIAAGAGTGRLAYIGNSSYIRFTGSGNPSEQYGIEFTSAVQAIDFRDLSTNVEADHLYIHDIGYSALNAKTDPTCDPATWRENFTMYDISFHDNYVKNTGGEGIYIGESHYHTTVPKVCNGVTIQTKEHSVIGVKIYNNKFENIGRDAIQVGSTLSDCTIHHNTILGFGATNEYAQQSGIQINPGTNAEVFNNIVDTGTGYGIFAGGRGASHFYNNIIRNALQGGIICADYDPLDASGFIFSNNTILNCNDYGIYMLSQRTTTNQFVNNIIVSGGTTYEASYTHVRLNSASVKWTESNNIKTNNIADLKFVNSSSKDFRLLTGSPAIDAGKNMTGYGVTMDLDENPRPNGTSFDIGAYEYQSGGPTSNAGSSKSITLPTNSVTLNGSGTSVTGITGYLWTKKSGGAAVLTNETTANLSVSGLVQGTYVFELRVTDITGFAFSEVTVNVLPAAINQSPTANAGTNKTITLPTNTLILNGIGTDPDGSIASYAWLKVSGPTATLTNASSPNLSLSNLLQGVYVFQLTVTDDKSATGSSQVTVTVNAVATNQPPIVNAGSQKTIFLPVNQVIITATASDPDGSISTILWEKKSGGVATLTNTNTLTLTASGLAAGNYTFRITVTDNNAATSFSEVLVIVIQANQSPTASAGSDQSLTLPTNSTILSGSGIDPDGSVIGYAWIKVSGPTATLTNTNTATLTISNMLQGTYVFRLTVTDNNGSTGTDDVSVFVSVAASGPNEIPLSFAGGNVSFSLPTNSVNLFGSGFDADGSIVSYLWTKASGGSVTLTNANTPTLTLTNLQAGQYTFRLLVTDNTGATDDDVAVVTVSALGTNIFPVASAGADRIVKLPITSVVLNGSGTDEDGEITSYEWTQVAGSSALISSPASPATNISGLALGNYIFRLTVTDNLGATDLNETNIRVVNSTSNLPPIVDAGPDLKIFLPQNTLTINSTASDDGAIASFQWVKLSGGAATLVNPTEQNLSLSGLTLGEYTFQLTVTDNSSASVFDIVKVSVLPSTFNPPVADAGLDQEIALPTNQIGLIGTASSPTGTIVSTIWTKTLGPTVTLVGDNTLSLQCSNMIVGTYIFKLTVIDNNGNQASDNVQVIVNPIPPNKAPIVNSGQNYSVVLPVSTVSLTGTATDTDGSVTSVNWSVISGPNAPTLQNSNTLNLTADNLVKGLYIFRLSATDNQNAVGFNDAIVFVSEPSSENQAPIAYAGDDIVLVLPENSVTIEGDGIDPGGFVTDFLWEQVGGATANYTSTQQILNVSDLVEGEYIFRLTVSDTALTSFDEVKISVIEQSNEVPKFFSPNGDGYGETWVIRNIDSYQTCSLVVFSRSGQTIFNAKPYQNNWDGTFNGKPLSDGDYYYVMNCDDGRKIKGAVRLIR